MTTVTEAVGLHSITRRAALARLGRGVLALAGIGTLAAVTLAPDEALAKRVKKKNNGSNTDKKSHRKTHSNARKGTDNKRKD